MRNPLARAITLALAAAALPATAATDIEQLQQRLAQMERETAALRAELELVKQSSNQAVSTATEAKAAASTATAAAAPAVKGNRVFFRGGYAALTDDRANGAFTDMNDIPGALGLGSVKNSNDDG